MFSFVDIDLDYFAATHGSPPSTAWKLHWPAIPWGLKLISALPSIDPKNIKTLEESRAENRAANIIDRAIRTFLP